jgi:hypothetical protein
MGYRASPGFAFYWTPKETIFNGAIGVAFM